MHESYGVGFTGVGRLALLRVGSGVGSISEQYSGHVLERQGQCGRALGLEQVIRRQEQVVGAQLVYGDARRRMPWTSKGHIPCRVARKLALFGLKLEAWRGHGGMAQLIKVISLKTTRKRKVYYKTTTNRGKK